MTYEEALQLTEQGYSIARESWPNGQRIVPMKSDPNSFPSGNTMVTSLGMYKDGVLQLFRWTDDDRNATDWYVWEDGR